MNISAPKRRLQIYHNIFALKNEIEVVDKAVINIVDSEFSIRLRRVIVVYVSRQRTETKFVT